MTVPVIPPAYAGYLFDLDGTLADTAPDLHAALNAALASAGIAPVGEALARHWVGHGARVMIQQALDHHGLPHEGLDDLFQAFIEAYEQDIAGRSRLYPGVRDTLTALRDRGAGLAVVTNKNTRLTLPLLDALSLRSLFHTVVCGDTAARPKPAADPALHAAGALGLPVESLLFVGDSETDVLCARAAGCAVVCVPDGYNQGMTPEALGADGMLRSFRDLLAGVGPADV